MNRREFVGGALAAQVGAAVLPAHIQKPREQALALLKASQKEIDHGLELHANSLVIEPYGFSPRSAPDGDAIRAASEAGASDAEIDDLLEETLMTRCVHNAAERKEYELGWKTSGITCIFQNAGEESQNPTVLMKRLARFTYVTDMMGGFVTRAVRPDDIVAARRRNGHCLVMGLNGVPVTGQWVSVQDELKYIRIFHQLGVRSMHLTYNRRNMIGDGCGEPGNAGLSDFGRAAVAEMNRVGVIVDVAHSGWRTSLEAAKASSKPMMASHTSCAALHPHIRSKPDETFKAIVDSGGIVGIYAVASFLGGTQDLQAMLNHIDYVVKKFGADAAAIATDAVYSSANGNAEWRKIPQGRRRRAAWESLWPKGSAPVYGQAGSLAWTNWPLFTVGLVQRGYSDSDIQKIIGGNALRVAKAVFSDPVV